MKPMWMVAALAISLALASCSQSDQEKARERAHEADTTAKRDLHQLSTEAKHDAQALRNELAKGMNGDVHPSTAEAARKLHQAGQEADVDLRKAGKALDSATVVARVKAKLASNVGMSSVSSVKVNYTGGVVTLTGTVLSADQKRLAEQAAAQVDGVQRVQNDLTVQP